MRKLFSSHKRFIGLGLMSALVIALAVLGALWGSSQSASAQSPTPTATPTATPTPTSVTLVHVNADGSNYTGNPYCPDTIWIGTKIPLVDASHDCNNVIGEDHVIRSQGWVAGMAVNWEITNQNGSNVPYPPPTNSFGPCSDFDIADQPGWAAANDDEQCIVIRSSYPGETEVRLWYGTGIATAWVVKEWDSLVDSVILKYGDGDLALVTVYIDLDGDTVSEATAKLYLPPDENGDTVRDYKDEALRDRQSAWQEHIVVWDEARKRIKSPTPVEITEVVHGEHEMTIDGETITVHHPTQGAVITARIVSDRYCTRFTDSTGTLNYGATVSGFSDNLGRLVVYVDTVCEEQAKISFHVTYPGDPGSYKEPVDEWIGINWTTIELAKQPQIRWAGEEIVLEKRWGLPDEWFPNVNTDGTLMDICPHVFNFARYNRLITSSAGDLVGGIPEMFEPYTEPDRLITIVDVDCISRGLASSEDQGEGDFEVTIHDWRYEGTGIQASAHEERENLQETLDALNADILAGKMSAGAAKAAIYSDYRSTQVLGETYLDPDMFDFSEVLNKHAFLVWWLKIYQTKLTNVDGAREFHNAGAWAQGEGEDTEADTLNVSADTLLRVKVKGWFFGGNLSGHGAMCIDLDGDGDGLDNDGDTLFGEDKADGVDNDADTKIDEDLEAGVPYPITNEDVGCPDTGDEMLENGYWVLPDDLPTLAGPDAIRTRPNWDVMSEADAGSTGAVGPKSTLDSHDPVGSPVLRPWLIYKTIAPDGDITAADAIMPPLKIRASIASGDAGYLKGTLKGVDTSSNDYLSVLIAASPWIPAMVNDNGYDWSSWDLPTCPDADDDGVCDAVDKCPADFDPTNGDLDSDGTGDACDADTDGDTILDDGVDGIPGNTDDDNCRLKANATQADGTDADHIGTACDIADTVHGTPATDLDSDGDTVLDIGDNCPTRSNLAQTDTDGDGFGDTCDANPGTPWYQSPPVPYPFWTILNKFEREDAKETDPALKKRPYEIQFYTDNRGEGMFFANGDFNLSYDDCRTDSVSSGHDCSSGDVVGNSTISVIGDYPYFRKHTPVLSNPVEKTWTWGGDKTVTIQQLDPNHTRVIAHLTDRDGFCKWDAATTPTPVGMKVQFSPSLHPVEGEAITFDIVNGVGHILDDSQGGMSRNALFTLAPSPLVKTTVKGWEDGFLANNEKAVVKAEDVRLLEAIGQAAPVDNENEEECQAWVLIEHPLGAELEVSVGFDDPEGRVTRHWPVNEVTASLVQGWNDTCYAGPSQPIEEAMADIIDNVLAVYRYTPEQTWEQYFPDRCEEAVNLCTIPTLEPYDQLFILMAAPSPEWVMGPIETGAAADNKDKQIDLVNAWNSVCYAGADKPTEEAVSDIESGIAIMYKLASDQTWRRYIPGRPEIPDTLTTLHRYDSVILLVTAEDGITWKFDP